jgi:glycosyltransferase involved in cell wall biosynthesis
MDTLPNGGAERQLELLARYLPRDWESKFWSMDDGIYVSQLRSHGVDVIISKRSSRYDMSPAFSLWKSIASWKPCVVHSRGWMSTAAAIPVCKALRIPLIDGSIRGGCKPIKRAWIGGVVMNFTDHVIANSQAGLDAWGIDSKRGRVIYNGFDPQRIPLIQKEPINDGRFRVIMTGRMVKEKDYSTFIEAARILSQREDGWSFIAVGDGVKREDTISQAGDLIQNGIIEFPTPDLEVLKWVRQADVGVLLTDHHFAAEGCSNSLMEYMACGLPTICSESGGNRELVIDGITGFILSPATPEALANKLQLLRSNLTLTNEMGKEGKKRIFEYFSLEQMVQRTVAVYQELIRIYS